jgi:hypothetical protein
LSEIVEDDGYFRMVGIKVLFSKIGRTTEQGFCFGEPIRGSKQSSDVVELNYHLE